MNDIASALLPLPAHRLDPRSFATDQLTMHDQQETLINPALYLDFHLEMFADDSTIYFINNSIDTRSPFKFKSFFVFIHPKTEIVFSFSQNLKSITDKMIKDTLIAKKV